MKNENYTYNEQHMTEIADKYKNCSEVLSDAITREEKACTYMENNYYGQASELAFDTFKKMNSHLNLLMQCCQSAESYVRDCLETMQQADLAQADAFKEG